MIVMDSCAAAEIAGDTKIGHGFRALIEPNETIIAPGLFRSEIRNTFWKYLHMNAMTEETAIQHVEVAEALIDVFDDEEKYLREAFIESIRHNHPFYDMLYLCMARRNGATLFTLDKRLIDICLKAKVSYTAMIDF